MAFTASTIPDLGPGSRTVRFRGRDLQSKESIHSAVATLNLEGIPAVAKYQGGTFVVSAREGRLEISKDFGTDETVFHWSPDPALTLNKTYGYYSPMIHVPPNNNSINYLWSQLVDEEEL